MKRGAVVLLLMAVAFLAVGCANSRPIDVELAEQNKVNIDTTNEGTMDLMELLDRAKVENDDLRKKAADADLELPESGWTPEWDEGTKVSHLAQMAANETTANKVLDRAKKANPEE